MFYGVRKWPAIFFVTRTEALAMKLSEKHFILKSIEKFHIRLDDF